MLVDDWQLGPLHVLAGLMDGHWQEKLYLCLISVTPYIHLQSS